MKEEIIIIGGGITGLTIAFALKKQGVNALILEANNRLGGRIFTKKRGTHSFELGATWVFQDPQLKQLIQELKLELYPQYLTGDALIKYDPSMAIQRSSTAALMNGAIYHKVKGGTGAIINALVAELDTDRVMLNRQVTEIAYQDGRVQLTTIGGSEFTGEKVIITAPPKAIAEKIKITPSLSDHHLMDATHTWMGDSARFTVRLDKDFWRTRNLSGFVYSNYGLIREIQDQSSGDGQSFGLLGFMQPTEALIEDAEKRKQTILLELNELFGIEENNILAYEDFLWNEYFVDGDGNNYNSGLMPHQNNGQAFYLKPHFDNRLYFAGAETSPTNPGYMEGAVGSAKRVVNSLKNL